MVNNPCNCVAVQPCSYVAMYNLKVLQTDICAFHSFEDLQNYIAGDFFICALFKGCIQT